MRTDKPTSIASTLFKMSDLMVKRKKYIKNEFQAYGLMLAEELDDWKNRSLYIRLAKNTDRQLLENARYYVKDHNPGQIKTPYKLFMWKLKELKKIREIDSLI